MLKKSYSNYLLECGTDEAGRGCLAGPVTAAAVILPINYTNDILNDSKKLSEKKRFSLRSEIESKAVQFSITHIYNVEIDEINILNASMKAMQECILKFTTKPEFIIVDGNRLIFRKLGIKNTVGKILTTEEIQYLKVIPNKSIVKGDAKYLSIAAASVLAKTYRDEFMNRIHNEYPMYNWKQNKGYPTKEHREAIAKYGISPYHRKSFRLLPEQLELDFNLL